MGDLVYVEKEKENLDPICGLREERKMIERTHIVEGYRHNIRIEREKEGR